MEDNLWVWIRDEWYMLYSHNDITWRLVHFADRYKLRNHSAHTLKYWRKKGEVQGEEEKKNNGS